MRLGGESIVTPTGKSFRFVHACERARRGDAVWASERRFDPDAGAVRGKFWPSGGCGETMLGCPVIQFEREA